MDKNNPDNLPILAPITSIEDFFEACLNRRYTYNSDYVDDAYGSFTFGEDSFDINRYETAYKFYREQQGFSQAEIANALKMPLKAYQDIEDDEDQPPRDFIIEFCHFMDLHPADLIVEFNGAMNPAFMDILLYHYETHKNDNLPNNIDEIGKEKITKIIESLAEEVDAKYSYDYLAHEHSECLGSDNYVVNALARFIEKLMVNDGNPNFLPMDIIALEKKRIEHNFNYTEAKHIRITKDFVSARRDRNALGKSIFGQKWYSHLKILDGFCTEFGQSDLKDFFIYDLPWPHDTISEKEKLDLFGWYNASKIKENICMQAANELLIEREKREAFDLFLDRFEKTLKIYNNRQIIIERSTDLVVESKGEPNHSEYMSPVISWNKGDLKQKPVALLPKP